MLRYTVYAQRIGKDAKGNRWPKALIYKGTDQERAGVAAAPFQADDDFVVTLKRENILDVED